MKMMNWMDQKRALGVVLTICVAFSVTTVSVGQSAMPAPAAQMAATPLPADLS
jgi:hypothetical protein